MKFYKSLIIIVLSAFMLGACNAAPKEIDNVQATLEALSVQATIDMAVSQTMQASDAGDDGDVGDADNIVDDVPDDPPERTACNSYISLENAEQEVVRLLSNQDYAPLAQGILSDPFSIGYWMSEGAGFSADELVDELATRLTPGNAAPFTITFDLAQFPIAEDGFEWIDMFGPDSVSVAYSTGWGEDGTHEAMLYFKQDDCGGYMWYRMMYSWIGFEPITSNPSPSPSGCPSYVSVLDFEENLIAVLNTRNTQPLVGGMVNDPFSIGYYQSEGVSLTSDQLMQALSEAFLPPSNTTPFYATYDSSMFPPDGGYPWFDYLGPDTIEVIYTTGWGADGSGEAFLYLKQNECGNVVWFGMLYSLIGFP